MNTFDLRALCGILISIGWLPTVAVIAQQPFAEEQFKNQRLYHNQITRQLETQVQTTESLRPFPELDEEHAKFIDDLLDLWEETSGQVNQYTCGFERWDFDPAYCNYRDPIDNRLSASTYSVGSIRFAAPDKGMFEIVEIQDFLKPPTEPGGEVEYKLREKNAGHEKWICDGQMIYEFDLTNKTLYESQIPEEMQGDGLANSPLPFLFGVKKEILKERFWIRCITPADETENHWLEVWPKQMEDARNYQKIEVVLSSKDFLPVMLYVYPINYDQARNPAYRAFRFANRKVNGQLARLKNFAGFFVRPHKPIGWRRVERNPITSRDRQKPPTFEQ